MRHTIQTKFPNWWTSVCWCPGCRWGTDPSYNGAVEGSWAAGALWASTAGHGQPCLGLLRHLVEQSEVYAKETTNTYSSVCMWPRRCLPHWHLSAKHPSWIRDPGANAGASGIISQGIREEPWQSILSNRLSSRQCL